MKRKLYTLLIICTYIFIHTYNSLAADSLGNKQAKIYSFNLDKEIMPAAGRLVSRAVEEAESKNADYIIMRLNTFGGMVNIADSIRTKLLKAEPITIVFIDNNAASAGALISIACDSIYMAKGANIGAATVVNQTGEQMPDKYQSYMRSIMRSTAEAQGRDTKIAEAMVDDRVHIPGVIDSGYTLTFTTKEAIQNGFSEGQVASVKEIIEKKLGIKDYELLNYEPGSLEGIINFLINPAVSGILMLIIIGGLYFELQTPGVGFPIIASIIAATLYFAPLYLEGLAENWEILLFVAGIILLAVEIFVIPGFGIAGISGIVLILTGLTLSLVQNVVFDFSFTGYDAIGIALFRVVLSLLGAIAVLLLFGKSILSSGVFQKMVLAEVQNTKEGYTSYDSNHDALLGKKGKAITDLRPGGIVEIENERYDVISDGEHINKNSEVDVVKIQGNYLVVRKSN